MAMYARRGSTEQFTRKHEESPVESMRRKLSFNPVGDFVPAPAKDAPVGAYEVDKSLRIAQVCIAVTYCLVAAGIIFGFAAFKPVLIGQDVYRDRCTTQELEGEVYVCYGQELRLNVMFTVAAVSTNVAALPVGTILDLFGPRITSMIGALLLALGAVTLAFASDLSFDAYIPGYLLLALGGPFVFIPSFQLSNTFPKRSGLILALLTGAFDTSSAVFLIYRLIYQNSNGTITPKKFFLTYLIIPALVLLAQIFVMPHNSYKTVGELVKQAEDPSYDTHESDDEISHEEDRAMLQVSRRQHRERTISEITALLGSHTGDEQAAEEDKQAKASGVYGALHGKTAIQQIASWWFVLITLFAVVQMTRINYFVATIWNQYSELLGSNGLATQVNDFFDMALPLGGILAVPFIGLLLDYTSTLFVLFLLAGIATAIGVLGCIPQVWAAYANVCLFVLYRPLFYTAISDYSAKVFGFVTFGKVYGLIICLSGLFNFSQAGLDTLTHTYFGNDPLPGNVLLLGLALVIGMALCGFVGKKSHMMRREVLHQEAEEAREVLIPNTASQERTYGTGD